MASEEEQNALRVAIQFTVNQIVEHARNDLKLPSTPGFRYLLAEAVWMHARTCVILPPKFFMNT
jgi:hypothetical protein